MELTLKHIHTYQELVKTQAVLPLCCGECGHELVPGEDEILFLECYVCEDKFYPGLRLTDIIMSALYS